MCVSVCWFQCLGVCTCLSVYSFGFGFFVKKYYNNKFRFYSFVNSWFRAENFSSLHAYVNKNMCGNVYAYEYILHKVCK